ncbi:hypothetical protein Tco_0110568 [Tanacetum coccineum]
MEFTNEGRIAWVEVEGIPFKLWTDNTSNELATNKLRWIRAKSNFPGWFLTSWKKNDEEQGDVDSKEVYLKFMIRDLCGDSDVRGAPARKFSENSEWNKSNKSNVKNVKAKYKETRAFGAIIDKVKSKDGNGLGEAREIFLLPFRFLLPTRLKWFHAEVLILIPLCVLFGDKWGGERLDTVSSIVAWLDKLFTRSFVGGMFLMLRSNHTKIGIIGL